MVGYTYEVDDHRIELEFEQDGSVLKGVLTVVNPKVGDDDDTFTLKADIAGPKSVQTFLGEASETCPEAFPPDSLDLKRAINELRTHCLDLDRARKAKAEEEDDNEETNHDVDEDVIEGLIAKGGVLNRYVEAMAKARKVHGDRAVMKLIALGALSAQLEPPGRDNPAGTNVIIIGEQGRGKNYLADAIAAGLPEDFVYSFESASAKSFYYQAEAKPDRFKHTWIYPNEAEATDALVETLRPLLSKGSASHKTVDSSDANANAFRELEIAGPITAIIPTTRNKLDGQLQSRFTVAELEDFADRVPTHSAQVSKTFLASHAEEDHEETLRQWRAAFSELTAVRRVVIPSMHEGFKVKTNEISHGARLWRNFLSLLLTNAWLEQKNREKIPLKSGAEAVVAAAEDYRIAYEIFENACERSVVNVSDVHRKILQAVYELQQSETNMRGKGFSLRKVGDKAGISHELVRRNRTYLARSLGYLHDDEEAGLRLVRDADPSWWQKTGEFTKDFPDPTDVCKWWEPPKGVDTVDSGEKNAEKPIGKPKKVSTEMLTNG
jgi:hypothetical protein